MSFAFLLCATLCFADDPYGSIADLKLAKPEDKVDMPSVPPPQGAIVLFDGKSFDNWKHKNGKAPAWKLLDGGIMQVNKSGDIVTKQEFSGHFKVHVEFRVPYMPKAKGQGICLPLPLS